MSDLSIEGKDWMMGARILGFMACVLLVLAFSGEMFAADLGVEVRIDKDIYTLGVDTLVLSVSGHNDGPGVYTDVHIALGAPNGSIYEVPGWSTEFMPILSNVYLEHGFLFPMTELSAYEVGDSSLPATEPGQYWFAAAFTSPGTLYFIADISFDWFEVKEAADHWSTGYVEISSGRYYDDEGDWGASVSADGAFIKYDREPELSLNSLLALPIDTCVVTSRDFRIDAGNLDAGDHIDMLGSPDGNASLRRYMEEGEVWYENDDLDDEYYSAGAEYRFVGYGGQDVGAFNVSVVAPQTLELHHPDFGDDVVIDASKAYSVEWRSRGSSDIFLGIDAWDSVTHTERHCSCRCSDDGEFTIPSSIMAQLPTGAWDDYPSLWIARANASPFVASGLTESGYAVVLSLVYGPISLE
ncbi:MAG: hypothetical protein JW941_13255 [Candidatus Coatesbacteria bacterium]|nr:hypothetical protein [Candidatus Coatesbacteria bacterium]